MTRKIFTRTTAIFFLINFLEIFYFLLQFLLFVLYSCIFLLVCLFFEIKNTLLIHIRLCGRVSDKKVFTRPISGNKITFFFDLNNRGCLHCGCLHCATRKALHGFIQKRAHKASDIQLFLQKDQQDIFKILKMFKNNMKFTRAAC